MEADIGCRVDRLIRAREGSNVLLQAPAMSDGAVEICPMMGSEVGDVEDVEDGGNAPRNLLLLSLSGRPERHLEAWRDRGGLPRKVAILSADDARSGDDGTTGTREVDGTVVSRTTVSSPGDLTGIGIKLSQCLSAWENEEAPTHVCLDSVTTLLQYGDIQRIFRFLNVLTRRVRSVDGVGHYHVDPGAHDDRTLGTIQNVFPDVFEYDPDHDTWYSL